jgi:SUMO ligase MMS21 Smc5/6 complex component
LTLQTFREPYGNKKCKHVFEKETILGYLDENGTVFGQPRQSKRRQRPLEGPKAVKCPQAGCEAVSSNLICTKDFITKIL